MENTLKNGAKRTPIWIKAGLGAVTGFAVACFFAFGNDNPDPAWGDYWRARPLLVLTLAGACGGIWIYLLDNLRASGSWKMVLGFFLSGLGFLIGIWMGIVAGFHGTMWN